jgi:hypothetical protein
VDDGELEGLDALSLDFAEPSVFASLDFDSAGFDSVFVSELFSGVESPPDDSPFDPPSGAPLRCAFLP